MMRGIGIEVVQQPHEVVRSVASKKIGGQECALLQFAVWKEKGRRPLHLFLQQIVLSLLGAQELQPESIQTLTQLGTYRLHRTIERRIES